MKWFHALGRRKPADTHDLVAAIRTQKLTIIIQSQIGQSESLSLDDDAVHLLIAPGFALRLYEPLMTRGTTIKGWNSLHAMLNVLKPVRIVVEDLRAHQDKRGLLDWIAECEAKGVEVVKRVPAG